MSIATGAEKIIMTTDSQLILSQIQGTYEARELVMQKYLNRVKQITAGLQSFEVVLVPRTENMEADAFSKLASSSTIDLKHSVMIEILSERGIDTTNPKVNTFKQGQKWYDEILTYKTKGSLLMTRWR